MSCPKCGEQMIVVRYHDGRGACGYDGCDGARLHQPLEGKEHLSRRCETCLYRWATPTKGVTQIALSDAPR